MNAPMPPSDARLVQVPVALLHLRPLRYRKWTFTGRLGMVQVPWALYPLHHLPVNQSVEPAFTWMTDIPDRLRRRLHWTRVPLPPEAKPTILLLYAGKDDAGSLDSYLHATCPDLSSLVWAIDIRRDKGSLGQDMLQAPVLLGRRGTTLIRGGRPQLPHLEHPPLVPQAQRPEAGEGAQ